MTSSVLPGVSATFLVWDVAPDGRIDFVESSMVERDLCCGASPESLGFDISESGAAKGGEELVIQVASSTHCVGSFLDLL